LPCGERSPFGEGGDAPASSRGRAAPLNGLVGGEVVSASAVPPLSASARRGLARRGELSALIVRARARERCESARRTRGESERRFAMKRAVGREGRARVG
jgi:hypothetical protein